MPRKVKKKQSHSQRKPLIGIVCLVIVLSVGFGLWYSSQQKSAPEIQLDEPIGYSVDNPAEDKPEQYVSSAGPDEPKYIRLPSINAEGFVQKVSIDQHRQIAVPTNIHLAGWYVGASKPGQPGLSIIDGHVDGRSGKGIFFQLSSLAQGDTYEIELGDGSIKQFRVMDVVTVDNQDAASVLFSQKPSVGSQLNLITCGGDFNAEERAYSKRVIVTSELIN